MTFDIIIILDLQIWAFEALPELAAIFAEMSNPEVTPLCLRWNSIIIGKKKPTFVQVMQTAGSGLVRKFY